MYEHKIINNNKKRFGNIIRERFKANAQLNYHLKTTKEVKVVKRKWNLFIVIRKKIKKFEFQQIFRF